jgi:hypothetical protein
MLWVKPSIVLFLRVMDSSRFMISGVVVYGVSLFMFSLGVRVFSTGIWGVYDK